jgi:hypothetical protein
MLAFYLAAPEVENDRRALNVLLKWVFETIAEGQFNMEQIWKKAKKGIKCCKSNFNLFHLKLIKKHRHQKPLQVVKRRRENSSYSYN